MESATQHNIPVFSVSELSFALKKVIEGSFSFVRIRGEISGFKRAASGHLYFVLKDENSNIDAVCWRGVSSRLAVDPEDGIEVICTGKVTTYPGRSKYQIVIETMEMAGLGALLALLDKRKVALEREGLFAPELKQEIPYMPRRIGVVTSTSGAVIKDILHRLEDRFPCHVLIWPVSVQGKGAVDEVTRAIEGFNNVPEESGLRPDVLIVARGGGSLEDLWTFNEEAVVRAAAHSVIPLISAIGHETDTTLIDYASDLRAPTPTAAAEFAVPMKAELSQKVQTLGARMMLFPERAISTRREKLDLLSRPLARGGEILNEKAQKLDDLEDRLRLALKQKIERQKLIMAKVSAARLSGLLTQWISKKSLVLSKATKQLSGRALLAQQQNHSEKVTSLAARLPGSAQRIYDAKMHELSRTGRLLESLSYENTLKRGYAIVEDEQGRVVTSDKAIEEGAEFSVRLKDGRMKGKRI